MLERERESRSERQRPSPTDPLEALHTLYYLPIFLL